MHRCYVCQLPVPLGEDHVRWDTDCIPALQHQNLALLVAVREFLRVYDELTEGGRIWPASASQMTVRLFGPWLRAHAALGLPPPRHVNTPLQRRDPDGEDLDHPA